VAQLADLQRKAESVVKERDALRILNDELRTQARSESSSREADRVATQRQLGDLKLLFAEKVNDIQQHNEAHIAELQAAAAGSCKRLELRLQQAVKDLARIRSERDARLADCNRLRQERADLRQRIQELSLQAAQRRAKLVFPVSPPHQ